MTYKNHLFSYDKFILYLTSNEFWFSLQELFSSNNNFEEQLKRGGNYYYNLIVDWKYILKRKGLKEGITKDKLKKEIKKLLTNYKFKPWYVNHNIQLKDEDSIRFWKVYEYLKQISK